jgi:hypothetical protein
MLMALAHGDALVLQARGFIDPDTAGLIAAKAEEHGYQSYLNVPSVRRIGMAFYETEGRPELIEAYFGSARRHTGEFRRACAPYVSPIDVLRCTLDDLWPLGAQLQTLNNRKMFIGLSRMVAPGTTFLAHHDIFAEDAPGHTEATSLLAQRAANCCCGIAKSLPTSSSACAATIMAFRSNAWASPTLSCAPIRATS